MPALRPAPHRRKVKSKLSQGVKISRLGVRHQVTTLGEGARPPVRTGILHERVMRAKLGVSAERWDEKRQEYNQDLHQSTRRALEQVSQDIGRSNHDETMMDGWEDVVENIDGIGCPDNNREISHEGGEYLATCEYDRHIRMRKQKDGRTWAEVIHRRDQAWQAQMPALADAYLLWKHGGTRIETSGGKFILSVMGIGACMEREFSHISGVSHISVTLIHYGIISCNPVDPSMAFEVATLEVFRRLRLRSPHVSIQAWVRVLCDVCKINYRRYLREQFTRAFDTYLDLLRHVDAKVKAIMSHDTPNWRMKHMCPSCCHKLNGETELQPSMLLALDGNNSLKRLARSGRQDINKPFLSDYYLTVDQVDQFKDEVRKRPKAKGPTLWQEAEQVDTTYGDTTCTDRWKAANADAVKATYKEFDESGIFLSACRHGFIILIADMVRSGELAKYPLAHLNKIIEVYDSNLAIGYDIACSFATTVKNSSLGAHAQEKQLRFVVPAFHGYAHNRRCQLQWHPLYLHGFGIEDLEVCERIFKGSNALASAIRHTSRFHRHQAIDMYFRQHDEDKYELLSTFLYNNYAQALGLIHDMPVAIAALTGYQSVADTHYQKWLDQERTYLASKEIEPDSDIARGQYVTVLTKMQLAKHMFDATCQFTPPTSRVRAIRQQAWEAYEFLQKEVMSIEETLDIAERWTPGCHEWEVAMSYNKIREYQLAVDKLEGLVVQRLFELTKANLSGTGYKLRVHISKSLQTRCKAIQSALKRYNQAAAKLVPPRPRLEWQEVVEYGTLAEFDLLRSAAREDIRKLPWADTVNRQVTIYSLRLERAKEEIARLNVEVARLNTWIHDSETEYEMQIHNLQAHKPLLCEELKEQLQTWRRLNDYHRHKLKALFALPGYTGSSEIGTQLGTTRITIKLPSSSQATHHGVAKAREDDEDEDEDDEDNEEMSRLEDYISSLSMNDLIT
ncbi:hypothetical protein JB92DRAFT_2793630 [Gautieria morchelliformis]|nr:hypothetical protein JB92DRAFT_2793630 [Gautieria morchelliformis]